MKTLEQEQCQFCHRIGLQFCHGHYHCTHCGSANFECCSGELNQESHGLDSERSLDAHSNPS